MIIISRIDYSQIINQRYFKIVVKEKDEELSLKLKKDYYKCICDCGNITSIRANDLYNNKIKSCGCYNPHHYKDIKNKKFDRLTAIDYKYTINKKAYWLCECDCGNIVIISASNLQSGHSKSCGCKKNKSQNYNIKKHFRNLLKNKIIETLYLNDYHCCLSKSQENLEVHHLESFDNLYKKAISSLNYPLYDNFNEYSLEQKIKIDKLFLQYHENNILVVLTKQIHIKFHKIYGYKNNNSQQFNDFIANYFNQEEP